MKAKFITFLFAVSLSSGLDLKIDMEQNGYEWLVLNRDEIIFYLSYQNEKTDSLLRKLEHFWIRKIDIEGREISNYFSIVLINYPEKLIKWFTSSPMQLDAFLHDLPSNLFADYETRDPKPMEKLKADLLKGLEAFLKSKPAKEDAEIAGKIIKRIKESSVIVRKD